MLPPQLIPATTKVKDVPLMASDDEYFRLLYTREVFESAEAYSGRCVLYFSHYYTIDWLVTLYDETGLTLP